MSNIIVTPEFMNLESPQLSQAVLRHIVSNADIIGQDSAGHPIVRFEFVCPPWLMDKLAALGAAEEDMEDEEGLEMGLCR